MAIPEEATPSPAAVAYDRELVPWLFEHWAKLFVDLAAPAPSAGIVDLACGSGLLVRHLVDRLDEYGRITGVDLDPVMLAHAATTIDDSRVSWHESDAARLPFVSESVDLVCCHQGLQFFPDRHAVLTEVRRVLRPKGRVAVAVWGRLEDNPWPAALSDAVRALLGDPAGDSMSIVCRLGDPDDLAGLLRNANFDDVAIEVRARTAKHPNAARAVAGQLSALPSGTAIDDLAPGRRTELSAKMCRLLNGYIGPGGRLSVPSTCVFATATKP
jgi:SAM-dependent methyltransferase